jgi:ComF family protein
MIKTIINWLMPSACILCGDRSHQNIDLCKGCYQDLPWLTVSCKVCALPLGNNAFQDNTCGNCLQKPPPFQRTIALWNYQTPLDYLITSFKFNHRLVYAKLLGELMAVHLQKFYEKTDLPECIIPIPLHKLRLRQRGFNQAVELVKPVSKKLGLKIDLKSCERRRATQAQASLMANERLNNIKNAFQIDENFKAKYVVVVDDVVTTGHTITEFCLQLRNAGVARIDVWCCARTLLVKGRNQA